MVKFACDAVTQTSFPDGLIANALGAVDCMSGKIVTSGDQPDAMLLKGSQKWKG